MTMTISLTPGEYPGAGSSSVFSVLSNRAVVRRDRLEDVVGNCRYRVNNHLDHKYTPRPVNEIIYSAKQKIGQEMPYSLLSRNCEHFVTNLRYGEPHSRQVRPSEVIPLPPECLLGCLSWAAKGENHYDPHAGIKMSELKSSIRF